MQAIDHRLTLSLYRTPTVPVQSRQRGERLAVLAIAHTCVPHADELVLAVDWNARTVFHNFRILPYPIVSIAN